MLYWGLGTYLGGPQPQNREGDRVYLVQDTGQSVAEDRSHQTEPGEDPITVGSVFTDTPDGVRVRYNRLHIEPGHYRSGRPLSDRQRAALDALDRLLNDPAHTVEFKLGPGDVFADNHVTLHNRRSFVDAPEVGNRRCLVRLWLAGEPHNRSASPSHRRSAVCVRTLIDRREVPVAS